MNKSTYLKMRIANMTNSSFSVSSRSVLPLLAGIILGVAGPGMPGAVAAEPTTPDPAATALEQLRAANQARSDLAKEEAAWAMESARLKALSAATSAETTRLERDATAAVTVRDNARARLAALGSSSDLDAVRTRLAESGAKLTTALAAVARDLPPGAVPTPSEAVGDGVFDAVVHALEAAEHSANSLAVEIVSGERSASGSTPAQRQAVKMLRVAGAAAWWVALDGSAAGTVRIQDGTVHLDAVPEAQSQAIALALAQVEGRSQAGIALLPAPASTTGAQP